MSGTIRHAVVIAKAGDRGYEATVEDADGGQVTLCPPASRPEEACRIAARRLRALADRFDRLAQAKSPQSAAVQASVNAGRQPK